MSDMYKFFVTLILSNDEGIGDRIFSGTFNASSETDLMETSLVQCWNSALGMCAERSDDGSKWDVQVKCLEVQVAETGVSDWDDDAIPQRDDVSNFLTLELGRLAPAAG